MIFISSPLQRWHSSVYLWSKFFKLSEIYIAIKTNETNMKNFFFRKTRNGKLIICNEKLIIMHWSFSKKTYCHGYNNQGKWNKGEKLLWLVGIAWAALLHKHAAELLVFSENLEILAECFKSSAEPFKSSAACFKTNARPSLLINGHIKSFW